jgi:hypothetical protein
MEMDGSVEVVSEKRGRRAGDGTYMLRSTDTERPDIRGGGRIGRSNVITALWITMTRGT